MALLEAQYRRKLDEYKNLQQQYEETTVEIKNNQILKEQIKNETRCLSQRDKELDHDVNTAKSDTQKAVHELQDAVEIRLDLQKDFDEQKKLHTQEIDNLQN